MTAMLSCMIPLEYVRCTAAEALWSLESIMELPWQLCCVAVMAVLRTCRDSLVPLHTKNTPADARVAYGQAPIVAERHVALMPGPQVW